MAMLPRTEERLATRSSQPLEPNASLSDLLAAKEIRSLRGGDIEGPSETTGNRTVSSTHRIRQK